MSVSYYGFADVLWWTMEYVALYIMFFHSKLRNDKGVIAAVISCLTVFLMLVFIFKWESISCYNILICTLCSIILSKTRNITLVINILTCLLVQELISVAMSNIFHIFFFSTSFYWEISFIGECLSFLFIMALTYLLALKKVALSLNVRSQVVLIIASLGLLFIFKDISTLAFISGKNSYSVYIYFIIIFLLFFIFVFVCGRLIYISSHASRNLNQAQSQYINSMSSYLELSINKQEEIRHLRHDLKNHLNVISTLIDNGNYYKASNYIKEVNNITEKTTYALPCSGNDLLDAIFLERSSYAIKYDIVLKCKGNLSNNIVTSDFDFSTIMVNLINNAVEYSILEHFHLVILELYQDSNIEIYKVINQVKDDYNIDAAIKQTSKPNKEEHGLGLANVKAAVLKYGGELSLYREKDKFIAKVIFYK